MTAFGFAVFGDFPGADTLAGSALIWNKTVPRPSTALAGATAIPLCGIAKRPHQRSPLIVASGLHVVHRKHRA